MSRPSPGPCLAAALDYLQRGWSAIPLCPADHAGCTEQHTASCQRPGKTPPWQWKEYQDRLPRASELRLYWTRNPHCNVGITLGPVSGLLGIDLDDEQGITLWNEWSRTIGLRTPSFHTPGGGFRLLFRWPDRDVPIQTFTVDGKEAIRILSKGSQTVMPPSRHRSGREYTWDADNGPDTPPLECPDWLLARILPSAPQSPGDNQGTTRGVGEGPTPRTLRRARAYLASCQPAVSGQQGHRQLFKVTCKLVKGFHLAADTALQLLLEEYNPRCDPPWSDAELRHKIEDAMRTATDRDGALLEQQQQQQTPPPQNRTGTTRLSQIRRRDVEWLCPYWVPLGKLCVLDGDPDLGKSTVLLDFAARVTTHGVMFNDCQGLVGNVVIMSAEDGIEDTILPRLQAAEADLNRVEVIEEIDGEPPVIPKDLDAIEAVLRRLDARLLLIDPLTAYLGVDTRSDQEIRRALHPLAKMAQRCRTAVIYLRHLNKGTGTKAIYRGGGSIAIIGAARAGMLVAADPDEPNLRVLAQTKHNLAPEQASRRYSLAPTQHGVCRVTWHGVSTKKADDLLQPPPTPEEQEAREESRSKLEIAQEWLRTFLANGSQPIELCHRESSKVGITRITLQRASRNLTSRLRVNDKWHWSLTEP